MPARFGVASFNTHGDALTPAQVREDLRRVLAGLQLAGLQEAKHVDAPAGWGIVAERGSAGADPILYGHEFRLTGHRSVLGCAGRAGVSPDRWINVAELVHKPTGTEVVLLNTHLNHHVQDWSWSPQARGYRRHMRRLRRVIREYDTETLVLVTADTNVDQNAQSWRWWWPQNALAKVGAVSNYATRRGVGLGTLGRRFVDAVFIRHRSAVISGWRLIRGLWSDHRAVVATVTLR